MGATSFSLIQDVVSFTGPQGDVTPTGFAWVDERTLEIYLEDAGGPLPLVLGAGILDPYGNAIDLDWDVVLGEVPDDQYVARFSIEGPWVTAQCEQYSAAARRLVAAVV